MEGSARSGNLVVSCQCENRQKLCLSENFQVCSVHDLAVCNVLAA